MPTAVVWPLAVRAQQPAMPVIGLLGSTFATAAARASFVQGLNANGYIEGQNLAIARFAAPAQVRKWHGVCVPSRRAYDCYRMSSGLARSPCRAGGLRLMHPDMASFKMDDFAGWKVVF